LVHLQELFSLGELEEEVEEVLLEQKLQGL
jgi:hypothetical protein